MSRFDRYLLSQLMVLFGFFSLILVSVYWVNKAVRLFDQLISDGQSAWVFLEFTALSLPNVIRLALPIAAFVATLYVTNRLSRESELVVMLATGLSPYRMSRSVLAFGVIVALLLGILLNFLVPASRDTLSVRTQEIAQNVTSGLLVPGTFLHPSAGITFYISEITENAELKNVFLSDRRSDDLHLTYTAERAFVVRSDTGPKLVMVDGMAQQMDEITGRMSVTRFGDFTYDVGAMVTSASTSRRTIREMSTPELLLADEAAITQARSTESAALYEAHSRIAQPLVAIFVPLIGFAIMLVGSFSRLGLWRQIGTAITALIVVQFASNAANYLASKSGGAWQLTYLPVPVAAGIAFSALWLAAKPLRRRRGGASIAMAVPA